ncbi:MAG: hypothetical protein MZW92_74665 [Comamonadaceae bacterium]|nr:hypothetical protein [Comamonadaceae bacterium]
MTMMKIQNRKMNGSVRNSDHCPLEQQRVEPGQHLRDRRLRHQRRSRRSPMLTAPRPCT